MDEKLPEHYERTISNTHEDQSRHTATSYKPRTARTQSDKDPQSTQSIVGHQPPKGPRRARGDTLPVRNKSIRTPPGQKRALFSKKSTFLHGPQTDTSTPTGYTEAGTGEIKKPTSTTSRLPGTPPLRKAKKPLNAQALRKDQTQALHEREHRNSDGGGRQRRGGRHGGGHARGSRNGHRGK